MNDQTQTSNGLRALRVASQCSQSEFANALGIHPVSLNQWEHRKALPGTKNRLLLIAALGLEHAELDALLTTPDDEYTPPADLVKRVKSQLTAPDEMGAPDLPFGLNALYTLRKQTSCSLQRLSAALDISYASLERWERGAGYPGDAAIRKMATRLKISDRELSDILITDHDDYEPSPRLLAHLRRIL